MDDKDQDQSATDTAHRHGWEHSGWGRGWRRGWDSTGRTRRRDRNWCALWSRYWRSKKADENTNTEGEVRGCTSKKEDLNDKAINQDENEAGHRPQSYQEDAGQKAEPESPSNLDCTPERN